MPDQYGVIARLLKLIGLSDEWQIVEPVPGGLPRVVMIQNEQELHVVLSINHDLPEEAMIARIQSAIEKATTPS